MKRLLLHIKTVTKHKHFVFIYCCKAGIPVQGILHDLSKFSPTEFKSSVKFYTDGSKSPNEKEREVLGYSLSWIHHQSANKHHFEYWHDYSMVTLKSEPIKMPVKYFKEMVCDRISASRVYMKDKYDDTQPLKYLMNSKVDKFMNTDTYNELKKVLTILSEKGERETFNYLKELKEY